MQTEVCLRRVPLPKLLVKMEENYPNYFAGAGELAAGLNEVPFQVLWKAVIKAMHLSGVLEKPMLLLGEDLAGGEPPERAFSACLALLETCLDTFRRRRKENGRLYPVLGFAAGCMTVILLL